MGYPPLKLYRSLLPPAVPVDPGASDSRHSFFMEG